MPPDTIAGGMRRTTFDTGSNVDSSADGRCGGCRHRPVEKEKHVAVHCAVLAVADDQEHNELCLDDVKEKKAHGGYQTV